MIKDSDNTEYTISSFSMQVSHPLDDDIEELGKAVATAINNNVNKASTVSIKTERLLFHHNLED